MNILKFFKLSLALLLATTFFSCTETNSVVDPFREGYTYGDGNIIQDYIITGKANSFYHSPSKGNIMLSRGWSANNAYEWMQMQHPEYADDVEYIYSFKP